MPGYKETMAVIVVHGVGKPTPGATVDALVGGLASRSPRFVPSGQREVVPLRDYRMPDSEERRSFPCHVRRAETAKRKLVFAEVWWGTESPVQEDLLGRLQLLRAALRLVVGLKTIFRASRREQPPTGFRLLRRLAQAACALLTGPVFALNLLLLAGYGALVASNGFGIGVDRAHTWIGAAGLACSIFALWRLQKIGARVRSSGLLAQLRESLRAFAMPLRRGPWASLASFGLLLACYSLWHAATWQPETTEQNASTAWQAVGSDMIFVLSITFGLATALLLATVLLYFFAVLRCRREDAPAFEVVTVNCALQHALWVLLIPNLWYALIRVTPADWLGQHDTLANTLLEKTLIANGTHWLLGVPVVLVLSLLIVARRRKPHLRLILPRIPAAALLIAVAAAGFSYGAALLQLDIPDWMNLPLIASELELKGYSSAFLAIVLLLSSSVRTGLSLADDVLSYIQKYTARSSLMPDRPIRSRFRRVVEHLHAHESFDHVLIVAHSQGTILALDELAVRDGDATDVFRQRLGADTRAAYDEVFDGRRATLLTAGSPFGHLYQHYFGHHYPEMSDERWSGLRQRLSAWRNVYRDADFVGREIGDRTGAFPENVALGPGGHVGYWTDGRFLRHVQEMLDATPTASCAP